MDKAFFNQQVLPHIIAVFIFLAVTVIFFHPVIFEGKILRQNDMNQGAGSAQEIVDFREKTGEETLWTNSMFGGMPAYLINVSWSGESISWTIQKVISLFLSQSLKEMFLAFLSFYVLLLVFGVRPYLAIAGALAYGLNTFFLVSIEAGHIWKVRAIAYMPLVLAGIHLTFRGKLLAGAVLTTLAMTLELLANHLQITYYLFLIVLIYGLVQLFTFIKEKKILDFVKISAILVLAVVIAVAANFGRLWSTYEYGKYSTRGQSELTSETEGSSADAGLDREYVFRWSSGKWESLTLLVPHFYGGASGQYKGKDSKTAEILRQNNVPPQQIDQYERGLLGYWGTQPGTAGPVYMGAIICFLFVLGFFFTEKKYRIWLIIAAVFSLMLSWGKNFEAFNYAMFDYFPGYSKFRSVTMTIVIAILSMNLLGFMALENLLKVEFNDKTKKKLFTALGIVGGLLILIAMFISPPEFEGEGVPRALRDAVDEDRISIVRSDVMRSLFFVIAAMALIYFYLKQKIGKSLFASLFVLLVTLDLVLVDARYIGSENYVKPSRNEFFQPTEADKKVLKDKSIFRVLNLADPFNEARTSNFHFSIGGYHGAKMQRYQDIISVHLQKEMTEIMNQGTITRNNTKVLSALNTKYFIAGPQENAAIRNPYSLGNAWLVSEVREVSSPDEEIAALGEEGLDSVAVIDVSKFAVGKSSFGNSGSIELVDYQPNKLTYKYDNPSEGLAVFSEIYYPEGWKAFIDGEQAEILRANYILRALKVPAGEHTIEFEFEPKAYHAGNAISLIGNIVLLLMMIGYLGWSFYKGRKKVEVDD